MLDAKRFAKALEGRIVADREHYVAVGGRKALIRDDVRMLIAEPRRILARREIVHGLIRKPCDAGIEHADVDLLAFTGRIAMSQRRKDADAAVESREQIRDGNADFLRLAIRRAGHAHHAAHGLNQAVVARTRRIRTGLPESRDRAINESRKAALQLVVA